MTNFVLVPGAWHPGWTWEPVARRLRDSGAQVDIMELPGQLSVGNEGKRSVPIEAMVEALVDLVDAGDRHEIVLVGHSLGGYAINGALASIAARVRKVVYYNAHIPRAGVSMGEAFAERMAPLLATADGRPDLSVPVPAPELLRAAFFPEASADLQQLVGDLLVPTPGAYFTGALAHPTLPAEHGLDCAYVLSEDDVILPPPATQFAEMVGVPPYLVPGGHESLITHPDTVAEALLAVSG